jgi:phosphopantetheine adenylyltransferase
MKFDKKYNEIILEYSENQKHFQNITLAIVPGSFKPPHKGHWDMIMEYAMQSDKVLVLISNISLESNSQRVLSKSSLSSLSKILADYTLENEHAISIVNSIKENADKLTLKSVENYINNLLQYLDKDSDMYKELTKYISKLKQSVLKSIRKTATGSEITPEQAKQIFDIFVQAYNMQNKVIVEIGEKASPMSSAVPIINDECENCKILLGTSNKGDDGARWPSFMNSFNKENNNEFIEATVDVKTNISATYIRNNIQNLQKDWFPDNLTEEDFQKIKMILLS